MADPAAPSTIDPYVRGRPCPNCGFARRGDELGPREHCPNCNNPYPELLPPVRTRPVAASLLVDPSTWTLVGANLLTIAAALWFDLRLKDLMLVYWLQSVMIGVSFFIRMLFRIRGGWHSPFTGDKPDYFNPMFFVVHYGFFHLLYLFFLKPPAHLELFGPFGLCVAAFALNHAYSLWYNVRRDRLADVDVTTLFWLPYARIIPMHVTIIAGPQIAFPLVLFLGLKTTADALMHLVEHSVLRPR